MKKLPLFLAILSLGLVLSTGRSFAQGATTVAPEAGSFGSYIDGNVGALFCASGAACTGRDARFQIQFEPGSRFFAFPLSISFGQKIFMAGIKPRFQYFIAPISALEKLWIGPGVGLVVNYQKLSATGSTGHVIELGMQFNLALQYKITKSLHVSFTPMALDYDFWRKYFVDAGPLSATGTDSKKGIVYGILGGVGFSY
ncbi:MAG: hypothetical protein V1495_09390 [Pseudomonadota bacterium]